MLLLWNTAFVVTAVYSSQLQQLKIPDTVLLLHTALPTYAPPTLRCWTSNYCFFGLHLRETCVSCRARKAVKSVEWDSNCCFYWRLMGHVLSNKSIFNSILRTCITPYFTNWPLNQAVEAPTRSINRQLSTYSLRLKTGHFRRYLAVILAVILDKAQRTDKMHRHLPHCHTT